MTHLSSPDDLILPTAMLLPSFRTANRRSPLLNKKVLHDNSEAMIIACAIPKDGYVQWDIDEEHVLKSCSKWGKEWPNKITMNFSMEVPPNATEAERIAKSFHGQAESISGKLFAASEEMSDFVDSGMMDSDISAEPSIGWYVVMHLDDTNHFEELILADVLCMYRAYEQKKLSPDYSNQPLTLEDFQKLHEEIAFACFWCGDGNYASISSIAGESFPECTFASEVIKKYGGAKATNLATCDLCQNFAQSAKSMLSHKPPVFPPEVTTAIDTFFNRNT